MADKRNISDFSKYKQLYKLKKKRSPQVLVFLQGPKDDWLIDVIKYKNKTGEVVHMSLITLDDVEEWVERYQRIMKFEIVEE